ncbi:MAG: hypothetical protein EPO08_20630 [Rhodospirillaceae bacterium]|nr:MAG: hypothetical protein EPO08_20630 [Rhodospirillaceae bacterium]
MRKAPILPVNWPMPLRDGCSILDICRIRCRADGIGISKWETDQHGPSEELRKKIAEWCRGGTKIRIESLNGAGEPLGSITYQIPETPMPPTPQAQEQPQNTTTNDHALNSILSMAKENHASLMSLAGKVVETLGIVSKNSEGFAEAIRKGKSEAPEFFVKLFQDLQKEIGVEREKRIEAEKDRDVLAVLLKTEQEKAKLGSSNPMVSGLREVKEMMNIKPPTIEEMAGKMFEAIKLGKTEDIIRLLQLQPEEDRILVGVNIVLGIIIATPIEKRQEVFANMQQKIMEKVAPSQPEA